LFVAAPALVEPAAIALDIHSVKDVPGNSAHGCAL